MSSWDYETDIAPREHLAHYIAGSAGSIMLDLFHKKIKVAAKDVHDYVTEIDKNIESLACRSIKQSFPDDSIYGEESGVTSGSGAFEWVIDPIDGTNNYVRGLPFAGVQIAILYGGKTVYSLLYRPFTQDTYSAISGKGAFYENRLTGEKRQIHVSDRTLSESIGIFDAHVGQMDNPSTPLFKALIDKIAMPRVFGVAVYDIPSVAEGAVEFLVTGIAQRYDVAPGWLLVEEAGGEVFTANSKPASMKDNLLIFSNKQVKLDIVEAIHG